MLAGQAGMAHHVGKYHPCRERWKVEFLAFAMNLQQFWKVAPGGPDSILAGMLYYPEIFMSSLASSFANG